MNPNQLGAVGSEMNLIRTLQREKRGLRWGIQVSSLFPWPLLCFCVSNLLGVAEGVLTWQGGVPLPHVPSDLHLLSMSFNSSLLLMATMVFTNYLSCLKAGRAATGMRVRLPTLRDTDFSKVPS